MARKAYDCLAQVLGHEPSDAEYRRLLRAAALTYRETIASNPTMRAAYNNPGKTSPEQRRLVENDDATAGWLMIQATIEAYPKRRVVKEFREWMDVQGGDQHMTEDFDREGVLTNLTVAFTLIATLTGSIQAVVEAGGEAFLTEEEDDGIVKAPPLDLGRHQYGEASDSRP